MSSPLPTADHTGDGCTPSPILHKLSNTEFIVKMTFLFNENFSLARTKASHLADTYRA